MRHLGITEKTFKGDKPSGNSCMTVTTKDIFPTSLVVDIKHLVISARTTFERSIILVAVRPNCFSKVALCFRGLSLFFHFAVERTNILSGLISGEWLATNRTNFFKHSYIITHLEQRKSY